ncbi:p21-activated protein kinase-interacting protein [Dirofilaria immitis]
MQAMCFCAANCSIVSLNLHLGFYLSLRCSSNVLFRDVRKAFMGLHVCMWDVLRWKALIILYYSEYGCICSESLDIEHRKTRKRK